MFNKILKLSLPIGMALAVVSTPSFAQVTEACPATAEQVGFNTWLLLENNKIKDGNKVYGTGLSLIQNCPDRYNAQGLGAILLSLMVQSGNTPEQQRDILKMAYLGTSNNDLFYDNTKNTLLKYPDGTEKPFYSYGQVNAKLEKVMVPNFVNLALSGTDMSQLIGSDMTQCPYEQSKQNRAKTEANAFAEIVSGMDEAPPAAVLQRLQALKRVCSKQNFELTVLLAKMYKRNAMRHNNIGTEARHKEAYERAKIARPFVEAVMSFPQTNKDQRDAKDNARRYLKELDKYIKKYETSIECKKTRSAFRQMTEPCPSLD
ncbi:MAG: hypothetical protein ABJN22_01075 [Litorimonas sp.]